jgi:hypothetical protein
MIVMRPWIEARRPVVVALGILLAALVVLILISVVRR